MSHRRIPVYHVTSTDRLSCLDEGLRPSARRGSERWQELERTIDAECPEYLRAQGVTRQNAVFAYPSREVAHDVYRMRTNKMARTGLKLATLELMVDPANAFVLDAVHIDIGDMDEDSPWLYWATAITLAEFSNDFRIGQSLASRRSERRVRVNNGRPHTYLQPEVIVPGIVAPDDMKLISVSEHDLSVGVW